METIKVFITFFVLFITLFVDESGTISFKKNNKKLMDEVEDTIEALTEETNINNSTQKALNETANSATENREVHDNGKNGTIETYPNSTTDDENNKESNHDLGGAFEDVFDTVKDVIGKVSSQDIKFFTNAILGGLRSLEPAILPVREIDDMLDLYIDVKILSLTAFNEISGEVNLVSSMKMTWDASNTPRWDPVTSMKGKISVLVPGASVWKPKLLLLNPARDVQDLTKLSDEMRLMHNGTVKWNVISAIEASCSVDISLFPFDTQVCTINIATWGYTSSEINLVGSFVKAEYPFFRESSVWQLLDLSLETGNQDEFAFITISLQFKRHWQYFMINILLAPVLLSFLSPCVFLLPASSGERISFSITCFLAFALFSSLLADNIPRSSSPVARLCYVLMNMTIESFAVVFCTILSLKMYGARDDAKVPSCIQTIVKTLSKKSRWEKAASPTSSTAFHAQPFDGEKHRTDVGAIKTRNNNDALDEDHDGKGPKCSDGGADLVDMETDQKLDPKEERRVTWRDIAHIMDYVFFIAFTGCMFVFLMGASYSLL